MEYEFRVRKIMNISVNVNKEFPILKKSNLMSELRHIYDDTCNLDA